MKRIQHHGRSHGVAGFTLVELLIAMALAAMLTAGLTRVFMGSRQNIVLADTFSKIQESGRFGLNYLSRDMRMFGYMGCVNSNMTSGKITNLLNPAETAEYRPAQHSFANPIQALDNYNPSNSTHTTAFASVTNTTITPVAGTDVIKSSSAMATDLLLSQVHPSTSNIMNVSGPANQIASLQAGMILMLTDCNTAHIFSISAINKPTTTTAVITHDQAVTPGVNNTQAALGINYPAGSQVLVMNTTVYYVGQSQAIPTPTGQPQINSLYRASTVNGGQSEELVPFVQDMQLLYAVDDNDDGSPDVYKTAQQITTDGDDYLDDVFAFSIELIVSGENNVGATPLPGFADDGRLRKRYTKLVNLRNAGLAKY